MLRRRIFLCFFLLTLASLVTTGWMIAKQSTLQMRRLTESKLYSTAALAQVYFNEEVADYRELAESIRRQFHLYQTDQRDISVIIADQNGLILGATHLEASSMGDYLFWPEIRSALAGIPAIVIRRNTLTQEDYMHLAVPVADGSLVMRLSVSLADNRIVMRNTYLIIFSVITVASLMILVLAYYLSRPVTASMKKLSEFADKVSEGNLYERFSILGGTAETRSLAESLNSMTIKLDQSFQQIQEQKIQMNALLDGIQEGIIAIGRDRRIMFVNQVVLGFPGFESTAIRESVYRIRNSTIADMLVRSMDEGSRLRKETQIGDRKFLCHAVPFSSGDRKGSLCLLTDLTEIRKLESIRSEFVSNVTHELNTPLTSILGYVETLLSGAIRDETLARQFLTIIEIETQRLKKLIRDILVLSSIEIKKETEELEPVDLREVSEEVFLLLKDLAGKRGIQMHNHIRKGDVILANRDHIKQLLLNLLDNAVKYNVDGGKVEANSCTLEGRLLLRIQDTGIGIGEIDKPRLFERFYRVDKSRSGPIEGTGLGLSIVKHIVILYKGTISFKSIPGQGSIFTVSFPDHSIL